MCGLGGVVGDAANRDHLFRMEQTLVHRGPDSGDTWFSPDGRVGLCHRRLSIIDLSDAGRQPMTSSDGQLTIVFNGEIYNYEELRRDVENQGIALRGHSDTEVLLELFRVYGTDAIPRLHGMFAFAVWDNEKRCITLARDPLGIKPLYLTECDDSLFFASELKALLSVPVINRSINIGAVRGYLASGSVPEPDSLIDGIRQLPSGHFLEWKDGVAKLSKYWSPRFPVHRNRDESSDQWSNSVMLTRNALMDSIGRHFVSDVPVGIFLSGGIDSTALVSLARQAGVKNIKTFSIGFADRDYDESSMAAQTASYFQTDHHEWIISPLEGQALFSRFLDSMDQPSVDGFNTFCVSKFAHDCGMKVVLSGLGGDELFGSYPSFRKIPKLLDVFKYAAPFRPVPSKIAEILFKKGPKSRLATYLATSGMVTDAYQTMRGIFTQRQIDRILEAIGLPSGTQNTPDAPNTQSDSIPDDNWCLLDQISFLELTRYMKNQLLRDSDVMSMVWGLELRVPFVDSKLFDVLCTIPSQHRMASNKRLLVEAVGDFPEFVITQPKRGFQFPFDRWISDDQTWNSLLLAVCRGIPHVDSWYQKWSLFCLKHFLTRLGSGTIQPRNTA
ncbi:MAG: asparagine synthase (glutamine-hydrolyzing) [Pirellula sp.]|jgi:asparagine synthase (glutamine-hydrolysing)